MKNKIVNWNINIAESIAYKENICLTPEHWEIIYLLRELYGKFNTLPNMKILINIIRERYGEKKGNSMYIYHLFPQEPIKKAAIIAGINYTDVCL
ncbi:TusE/DsrC/DsvC family sulfur relay protein [Enterobacteriaceae endosymbiont of Neohaemonia nigricornis]|uniref:TusE/DsrC/DsvC family sulfur relay protein n=1 Tax=Enterobacteriaceae endosymbiont of Neohaemonia nigricornis TaxID=2675792 RepID=UPI0014497F59|nr:TusE/DsrC/DsvC family sulfur relay protein [Enterobacteriaceae endosymbiont of Neohaemonia nigricornis]QJC30224.1 TusE/DsrC/DsvC family sulfur relay protein [Enterobacteriaceae endosymbiont of Neohaemonia nigricornis]